MNEREREKATSLVFIANQIKRKCGQGHVISIEHA